MIRFGVTTRGLQLVLTVKGSALKLAVSRTQLPAPDAILSAPPP